MDAAAAERSQRSQREQRPPQREHCPAIVRSETTRRMRLLWESERRTDASMLRVRLFVVCRYFTLMMFPAASLSDIAVADGQSASLYAFILWSLT